MAASPHIFLFTGDDTFSLQEKVHFWIEQFSKKYGQGKTIVIDGNSPGQTPLIAQLKNQLQSNSLFATTSLVIAKNILKSKQGAEVKDYLKEFLPRTSERTFFVLQEDVIEKKDTLYKTFAELEKEGKAKIEHFTSPEGEGLKKWIATRAQNYHLTLSPVLINYLLARLDPPLPAWPPQKKKIDLWKINNYVIKLASYARTNPITKEVIDEFVSDEVTTTMFDFIDTFFSRNLKATLTLIHQTIDENSSSVKSDLLGFMTLLNRQLREFIIIKEMEQQGANDDQIAEKLGWQSKRLWVVKKKVASWTHTELTACAGEMIDLEQSIKFAYTNPLTILDQYLLKN